MTEKLSVEQMVRNLLSQAIKDGVVRKADPRRFSQNDPQGMTAGDLCGTSNLLADYLRGEKPLSDDDVFATARRCSYAILEADNKRLRAIVERLAGTSGTMPETLSVLLDIRKDACELIQGGE